jgi:Holliday junction resolvase RusA-like endonuclease
MTADPREWCIPIDGYQKVPLSLNDRRHWGAARSIASDLSDAVQWQLIRARNTQGLPRVLDRVEITLQYEPRTNGRRDEDNMSPTLKVCIDACRKVQLLKDDTPEYVTRSGCKILPVRRDGTSARLSLLIREVSNP